LQRGGRCSRPTTRARRRRWLTDYLGRDRRSATLVGRRRRRRDQPTDTAYRPTNVAGPWTSVTNGGPGREPVRWGDDMFHKHAGRIRFGPGSSPGATLKLVPAPAMVRRLRPGLSDSRRTGPLIQRRPHRGRAVRAMLQGQIVARRGDGWVYLLEAGAYSRAWRNRTINDLLLADLGFCRQ